VIIVAYLLDRLVVLPIDRVRIRFGAQRRIEPISSVHDRLTT
jgi:hypothetical protein